MIDGPCLYPGPLCRICGRVGVDGTRRAEGVMEDNSIYYEKRDSNRVDEVSKTGSLHVKWKGLDT